MDRRLIYIAAGVLVLLLLAGGGLLLTKRNGSGGTNAADVRANTIVLAKRYMNQGEYQHALDLLDKLLITNPNDSEASNLEDQIVAAMKSASAGRQKQSESSQAQLASSLDKLGKSLEQNASRTVQQPVQAPEPSTQSSSGLSKAEIEKQQKADKVRNLINQGIAKMNKGDLTGARSDFNGALGLDPSSALALAELGDSYVQEDPASPGNLSKATDLANQAISKDPNLWLPHYTLAKVYSQTKSWDNAIKEYGEAGRLNPENPVLPFELGKIQYRAGQFQAAQQSFTQAIHLDPKNE
ncbi:MAG TPA: tetratricopeptide repeat protein, partial [Spirochaetia bacterium]|nr:tetratricopeptide repeat protein [Spirochaetia bacterium]